MPHERMNEQQVATYLTVDVRDVRKWAGRGQIPCRKLGDQRFLFVKSDIDHWVWDQMHNFDAKALKGIERGVGRHHGFDMERPVVCPLIPEGGLCIPLEARTRDSALRGLVERGEELGLVYGRNDLLDELQGREQLCSTALLPEVAFPHPRQPLPYGLADSFVLVARTPQGIPFGADGGGLTRLFFLVCCKDDRTHLHVLARLVRMLDHPDIIARLIEMPSADLVAEALALREMEVLHNG